MRVITGSARSRRLQTLPGEATRPTAAAVKEAMFSIIAFEIEGRSFLDLFAGSGQLGIEALSRGASRAVFVDSSRDAVAVVRRNVEACGFLPQSEIRCADYRSYLASCRESFHTVLLDSPYASGFLADAMPRCAALLKPGGLLVCEHPAADVLPEVGGCVRQRTYRYGRVALTLFRRSEQA